MSNAKAVPAVLAVAPELSAGRTVAPGMIPGCCSTCKRWFCAERKRNSAVRVILACYRYKGRSNGRDES